MQDINQSRIDTQNLSEQHLSWAGLGVHTYIKLILLAAVICFVFHNEVFSIVSRWVTDSSWSHGFIIPFFSLYFLCQKKDEILSLKPKSNYIGLVLLICCLLFYMAVIFVYKFGYFRSLVIIPTIGSVVLFIGGWNLIKYTWLPVAYLVFAIPLPARLYGEITIPMRELAAAIASQLLSLVKDLDANVNGVVIDVVYKGVKLEPGLDVAEACSGMRLLMAFLALGVAMAYLHYRPMWQRIILLASTVPIAIFCNVVRVTTTGFIYILWDPVYAQGIYHDMLGLLMLPLAFGLYGLLAWIMSNLVVDEAQLQQEDIIIRRKGSQEQ
ncbi:MAG: exosortase [Sedimentisphaerales bacterium]|nr:exosortase [Sedimentisphaerales bacterium]